MVDSSTDDEIPEEVIKKLIADINSVVIEGRQYAVNEKLAHIVIATLDSMGVKNSCANVATWSSRKFYAIANFREACEENCRKNR